MSRRSAGAPWRCPPTSVSTATRSPRSRPRRSAACSTDVLRRATRSTRASSTPPASSADALRSPSDLARLPFTTKAELVADQDAHPPWGIALTEPLERYTRYCQTSSTTGRPLRWIDTNESWQWMLDCWKAVYRGGARRRRRSGVLPVLVRAVPRLLGRRSTPAARLGLHCIPAGGMSSQLRLAMIDAVGADGGLLHADLRAAAGRGRGGRGAAGAPAGGQHACGC